MAFALRVGIRDYPLMEGKFIIGRSESCQLCLDDPMASRNHAAVVVSAEGLMLEDMGSRNGVYLNKTKLGAPEALKHGDVIRIGAQEMTIVQRRTARAETLAQVPVESAEAFGVLGGLADKAITLGRGEEAERILARQLEQILATAEKSGIEQKTFERAAHYASRIAALTKKGKWLDYLFRLYATSERLMEADLVNDLYSLSSAATNSSRAHLRAYVASLAASVPSFGPSERFVLSRLEGLERQL